MKAKMANAMQERDYALCCGRWLANRKSLEDKWYGIEQIEVND